MKQRFFDRAFGFCGDLEVVNPKLNVGVQMVADGGAPAIAPRQGKTSEAIVSQAHGKYYEATSRGNIYSAAVTAGQAPGTALGVHPSILLYNPAGSGKRLSIKKVSMGQAATGTLGTGTLYHSVFTLNGTVGGQSGVAPVVGSGAALTPINNDVGASNSSVATVFQNGTLSANPALLYPFANLSEAAGGTIAGNSDVIYEDVDGAIVLEPGSGWCLEALAAAGSSPLIEPGVVWEEIPIV
jgi:hypothetical protein